MVRDETRYEVTSEPTLQIALRWAIEHGRLLMLRVKLGFPTVPSPIFGVRPIPVPGQEYHGSELHAWESTVAGGYWRKSHPTVVIDVETDGQGPGGSTKLNERFYLPFKMNQWVEEYCTDDELFWRFKQIEADGGMDIFFDTDELRANPIVRSYDELFWRFKQIEADGGMDIFFDTDELRANPIVRSLISGMLDYAKIFDQVEYAERFLDFDMVLTWQRTISATSPSHSMRRMFHIHLIDDNWEKNHFNEKIWKIRKWVQVMVFGADESESEDELGDQDREMAYREEEEEMVAIMIYHRVSSSVSTHGVRRVPLRLAGVGSTTSLPPQRGPSEISLRGSNYFQSPPPLRLTPQLQKMSTFSGTEMGATTLPRSLPPPPLMPPPPFW